MFDGPFEVTQQEPLLATWGSIIPTQQGTRADTDEIIRFASRNLSVSCLAQEKGIVRIIMKVGITFLHLFERLSSPLVPSKEKTNKNQNIFKLACSVLLSPAHWL